MQHLFLFTVQHVVYTVQHVVLNATKQIESKNLSEMSWNIRHIPAHATSVWGLELLVYEAFSY
jgi:hypothetical protein